MKRLVTPGAIRKVGLRVLTEPGNQPGKQSVLPGVASVDVTQNSSYQADKWSAKIALNATGGHDAAWWGQDERIGVLFDVKIVMDGEEDHQILGEADSISLNPQTGMIEIEGRDLTARFIDNRIQEAFQNKTAVISIR